MIAAGSVSTQAISTLRTVAICRPEPLAAIVPATLDDNTCVVNARCQRITVSGFKIARAPRILGAKNTAQQISTDPKC